MSENSTRRQFIRAAGGATVLALAGCTGDDSQETPTSMGDQTTATESMGDDSTSTDEMNDESMDDDSTSTDEMDDDSVDSEKTFTVRVENVAATDFYGTETVTGGAIWITPGAFAVHSGPNPVYSEGESASIGLEALSEAGPPTGFEGEPGLVSELQATSDVKMAGAYGPGTTVADPNDPKEEVPGAPPIAPGGAFEFEVTAHPDQKLSFASMFVPSNDIFIAPTPTGIPLWDDGEPVDGDVTEAVDLWDAGTEPNQAPGEGADQAPAQSSADQGADENGVVRPLSAVDDGYEYPDARDVIQVVVTPN
jgi:hypothetical protein